MDYDLSKISKEDLENILHDLLCEVSELDKDLTDKYKDEIEDYIYSISLEEAQVIVSNMKPFGEVYNYDTIKHILTEYNNKDATIHYYLCMNMYYNDAKSVADKYKIDAKMFCYDMSQTFIDDVDATDHKVEKYFLDK